MKHLLGLIILFTPALARAKAVTAMTVYKQQALTEIAQLKQPYINVNPGGKMLLTPQASHVMSQIILTGIVALKGKSDMEDRLGRPLTAKENWDFASGIVEHLLYDPQILLALKGATLAQDAAMPMARGLIMSGGGVGKVFLKNVLARSILNGAALPAASAIVSLWQKSFEKLPSDKQKQFSTFYQSAIDIKNEPTWAARKDKFFEQTGILDEVLRGMGEIAIVNPRERNMWVYDWWRNDIANGNTLTFAATTTLGASAGWSLGTPAGLPGKAAGAFAGTLVGAAVAEFTPDAKKEELTEAMQDARANVLRNRLTSCYERVRDIYRLSESPRFNQQHHIVTADLVRPLNACEKLREGWVTIKLDQIKAAYGQIEVAKRRRETAQRENRNDEVAVQTEHLSKATDRLARLKGDVLEFFDKQAGVFGDLLTKYTNADTTKLVADENSRLDKVRASLKTTLDKMPETEDAAVQIFTAANAGFAEGAWLPADTSDDQIGVLLDDPNAPTANQ